VSLVDANLLLYAYDVSAPFMSPLDVHPAAEAVET
jgi:hypothetical protein